MTEQMLKKCPFCGSSVCEIRHSSNAIKFYVGCSSCHALGPMFFNEEEAVYAWNDARQSVEQSYEHKEKSEFVNYLADEIEQKLKLIKGCAK
jgi:Lar family restriction alleviation protein